MCLILKQHLGMHLDVKPTPPVRPSACVVSLNICKAVWTKTNVNSLKAIEDSKKGTCNDKEEVNITTKDSAY